MVMSVARESAASASLLSTRTRPPARQPPRPKPRSPSSPWPSLPIFATGCRYRVGRRLAACAHYAGWRTRCRGRSSCSPRRCDDRANREPHQLQPKDFPPVLSVIAHVLENVEKPGSDDATGYRDQRYAPGMVGGDAPSLQLSREDDNTKGAPACR